MKKCVIAPIESFYSDYRNPLPESVSLSGGYKLKKFDTSVLDYVFDFFGQSFSERDRGDLQNCRYAIYYYYDTDEEISNTPERIINEIGRILLTLRIVKRTRAIATIFHFKIRGKAKDALQVIHKPLINITFPTDVTPGSQHFNKADSFKIRKYYRFVNQLYSDFGGTYHKVLNALFFFELAHQNHLYKPRMVNLVTGLESLFNTSKEQVGYTLKIRCSYFLEKDSDTRLELGEKIKEIYDLRSTFVHGQGASRRILESLETQNNLLSGAEEITRRCLQKIFDDNLVDIFGDIDLLNSEFKKLELGVENLLVT